MNLTKEQKLVLGINSIAVLLFTIYFMVQANWEFIIYVGVIIFFFLLILFTINKVKYPNYTLWGLTIWSLMHMCGGAISFGEKVLYEMIVIPIVGEPYHILKYDQVVHAFGFGVATLIMFALIAPSLKTRIKPISLMIVIAMAGLGVGALNEIIEFMAVVVAPSTGVGGYYNTSLDLVANSIGAVGAVIYLWFYQIKNNKK